MCDFLPGNWYAQLLFSGLIAVTLLHLRTRDWHLLTIAAVMWAAWASARAATHYDSLLLFLPGCVFAAFALGIMQSGAAKIIALLYIARLPLIALNVEGIMPTWLMWELSNLLFLASLALVAYGPSGGKRNREYNQNKFYRFLAKNN